MFALWTCLWPTVGNKCRNGIQLCILSNSDCPKEELHLCCRSKKATWILLPHAAGLWISECSLVCVFCLICTWLILSAVMASKWSVFNKQAWWTLSSCFMNRNSLVWTLARVEIPLTVWCYAATFQLRYYPTIKHSLIEIAVWINSFEHAAYFNWFLPSYLTVNPLRTCIWNVCSQTFVYIRRWCWDSCTWRHLQQVKVGSRSAKND